MSIWTQDIVKRRLAEGDGDFKLSKREIEFLELVCQDIPCREIADIMELSPRTVDGFRDVLFEALQVRSRTGLVLWCFKSGFLKVKDIRLIQVKRRPKQKKPAKNSRAAHMKKRTAAK